MSERRGRKVRTDSQVRGGERQVRKRKNIGQNNEAGRSDGGDTQAGAMKQVDQKEEADMPEKQTGRSGGGGPQTRGLK